MENFYRDLIHSLPDIIYHIDRDGNFIYLNDSISKLGYFPDELIGRHFSAIMGKEQAAQVDRELFFSSDRKSGALNGFVDERRTGTRLTKNLTVNLIEKTTGAAVSFIVYATGLYGDIRDAGTYCGSFGIIREYHSTKGNSDNLLRTERYYRLLLDNSLELLLLLTNDGIVLFAGNSVTQSLGADTYDLIGEDITERIHPDDRFLVTRFLKKQDYNTGIIKGIELRLRSRESSWCYFETMFCPISEAGETTVVCYVMHAIDITRRKKLEDALAKRERLYKSLLRTSPDAIVLFDSDGDVILANDRAAEITNLSRDDMLGRNFISFLATDENESAKETMIEFFKAGQLNDMQFTLVTDSGIKIPIEVSFSVIKEENGILDGYLAIFKDITARKKIEAEKTRLSQELHAIVKSRLSDREIELLRHLSKGYTWPADKREISKLMDVLPGSLDQFVYRIRKKMELHDIQKIAELVSRRI